MINNKPWKGKTNSFIEASTRGLIKKKVLAETLLLWKIANFSEAPGTKHDALGVSSLFCVAKISFCAKWVT